MKKVLFVESRYVTYLYDKIAEKLIKNGHEVHWIVLNHQFNPRHGKVYLLKYPKTRKIKKHESSYLDTVISTDRQLRFFDKKETNHFYHYDIEIKKILETITPDIVFGEPTAFHHLITLEICKEMKTLYLHPASCRYPINRFAFYKYDTLEPYKGSRELLSNEQATKAITDIVHRNSVPNYMIAPQINTKEKLVDKIKILKGYLSGERNNTPSPITKLRKDHTNKAILKKWNKAAVNDIDTSKFVVLFPLHMQPESSIDVWGREFSDQNKVIREISERLKKNEVLYIKPNPKSSFEINTELIKFISERENVIALNSNVKMGEIFDSVDLFVNVVGTIAIECILSGKPVISLVKTYFNDMTKTFDISLFDEISQIIELVKGGKYEKLELNDKIKYFNKLNSLSYKGLITDTFNNKNVINESNINNLFSAFVDVIENEG